MAELVYILCALASVACALLLIRNYRRTRLRLALFTCLCFTGLALNNLLLLVDLLVVRELDLSAFRTLVAVVAVGLLVLGLVLEDT
jgi:hypothetical protein